MITQGGAYINGEGITAFDQPITREMFQDNTLTLRAGKKRYHQILMGQ